MLTAICSFEDVTPQTGFRAVPGLPHMRPRRPVTHSSAPAPRAQAEPVCDVVAGRGTRTQPETVCLGAPEVGQRPSGVLESSAGAARRKPTAKSTRLASDLGSHLAEQLLLFQAQPLLLHLQLLQPHLLLLAGAAAAQDAPRRALRGQWRGLLHRGALADSLVHGCKETKHLS